MNVEQQVDAMTASVEDLKWAVVSKKATLDASVADAQSATAQAQAAKANALFARDQAGAFKDAAYTAAQSAASAVSYQDLSAVALTKAVTAIDVFIYDTSKDSDGGAWRHRCAGTSWYREPLNTTTRGPRRDFPAVAVIVAEATRVTIYDGDDPAIPMWMVFIGNGFESVLGGNGGVSSVNAINGRMCRGSTPTGTYDLVCVDFVGDRAARAGGGILGPYRGNVSERNVGKSWSIGANFLASAGLVDRQINNVAMTVLPDAPIDPATRLPVPTIAVATAGGTSFIHHDGTVQNVVDGKGISFVFFGPDHIAYTRQSVFNVELRRWIKVGDQFVGALILNNIFGAAADLLANSSRSTSAAVGPQEIVLGGINSVGTGSLVTQRHLFRDASLSYTLNYLLTSTYASGWLPGAILGAFLADTADTDLVATQLVMNGTFDTDVSGWIAEADAGLVWNLDGSATATPTSGLRNVSQSIATVAGRAYVLSAKLSGASGGRLRCGTGVTNAAFADITPTATPTIYERWFIATGATTVISFFGPGDGVGSITVDAISLLPADADRSVNSRGLVVNGTITRAPVATGAELVAYSGFSASNYLEQPYNSALDFGTGDFCVMGWVKPDATASRTFISYEGDQGWQLDNYASSLRFWEYSLGGSNRVLASATASTVLQFICVVVTGRVVSMYVNGALVASGQTTTRSFSNGTLRVGRGHSFLEYSAVGSQLSLWRISATAPTADQIRRIYEDERALFQENAACTLYGASDAVTALAHDPDTGLLHVGTSAGRSVFRGLRRVANTTVPVGAAIAAAGGMVVEE